MESWTRTLEYFWRPPTPSPEYSLFTSLPLLLGVVRNSGAINFGEECPPPPPPLPAEGGKRETASRSSGCEVGLGSHTDVRVQSMSVTNLLHGLG